jgi:lipoprotein NlpD
VWLRKKIVCLTLLVSVLVTAGCGGFVYHRVQPGESLYSISWRYGLDYREVAGWNKLEPPYTIFNGQLLRVTPRGGREQEAVATAAPIPQPAPVISLPRTTTSPPPLHQPAVGAATAIKWQWPTQGTLKQIFSDKDFGRKGIDIGGQPGQPVLAAAAGHVVYAGSGLSHYGNLIILKHDDNYLSAYAYNRVLLVHEGDAVTGGQHIADMGSKAHGGAMLHFEIRYDGRPINPLKYLPPRQ